MKITSHSFFASLFHLSLCLLFLGLSTSSLAQEKKPKVALVLSGGGAKGIAHIPLLQKLDSLEIVPDMIIGTSMGSIVGGLYAMGYSGDSIAQISQKIEWNELIGGKVSLKNVSVEEKSEFNRYLVALDWKDGKINIGRSLLNDQNLRQFISSITFPAYKIDDFDQLEIPYRAVTTDIVNGKEVILKNGSLAFAMRASMSIPGAFSPVPYQEDILLVDGGLLNNFPVDVAKEMGADIIIGSDVGDGMKDKDELKGISDLLFQAAMLSSNLKNPKNRAMCDILLDHTPNLSWSTADFQRTKEIYKEGKIALIENNDALVALSQQLKPYQQKQVELMKAKERFVLDTIIYEQISPTNMALVKARTNIRPHREYGKKEIIDGINRAMGTTIFDQITYEPFFKADRIGLVLKGYERSPHQIKGGLHYDNDFGVGILVNYTGRNILGAASRSMISLDIAEQPRVRLQHQKNFGGDRNWWWQSELYGQSVEQPIFIGGERVDDIRFRYFEFANEINRNLNSLKNYIGFGLRYHNTLLKPTVDPTLNNNIFSLEKHTFDAIEVDFHYVYNTLDLAQYPTRGAKFKSHIGRSLRNKIEVLFSDPNLDNQIGSTSQFIKLGADYEKRVAFSSSLTGIFGTSGHFTFIDDNPDSKVSYIKYGIGSKYLLGGNIEDATRGSFVFPGLNRGELIATQFVRLHFGLQYKFKSKFYLTPHADVATVGFRDFKDYAKNVLNTRGRWQDASISSLLFSSGLSLGYDSILGPVNLDVSWVNDVNKLRLYFGVGFQFSR